MIAIHLFISWFSKEELDPLDDCGRTHAGADAQRHQCGREIASLQFINDGAKDHGAGRAERVTHSDRPAVDIDLGRIEVESELGTGSTFRIHLPIEPPRTTVPERMGERGV